MKFTSFNPSIITSHSDDIIRLFESLGFERRHMKTGIESSTGEKNINANRMKHPSGFYVDVTQVDSMERDMMTIRMNVDNFEEAREFLAARGFQNVNQKTGVTETPSSRATMMVSPSGFSISITEHIKE